jgi:hypothetical protein
MALQLLLVVVRVAETQGVTTLMTASYDTHHNLGPAATLTPAVKLMLGTTGFAGANADANPTALALRHAP